MQTAGQIFYDAQCPLCSDGAGRVQKLLHCRGFALIPLQSPDASHRLGISRQEDLLREVHLLLPDGKRLGGVDAILEVARRIWWAWPLWLLSRVPGMMPVLRPLYRVIAAHRMSISRACALPQCHP